MSGTLLVTGCGNPFGVDAGSAAEAPSPSLTDPETPVTAEPSEEDEPDPDESPDQAQVPDQLSIPETWLSDTTEAWPESAGYEASIPVLSRGRGCLLAEDLPVMFGTTAQVTDTGFGPGDPDADDAYQYICHFWSRGHYAGKVQLLVPGGSSEADTLLTGFLDQPSTDHQENHVETVEVGEEEIHVLTRWYPVAERGMYQALFADDDALVILEISSLEQDAWYEGSAGEVARHLATLLAGAPE